MADCGSENMNIICGQQANGLYRYPCPTQPCCPSLIAGPTGPTGPAGVTGPIGPTGALIYEPTRETRYFQGKTLLTRFIQQGSDRGLAFS